MSDLLVTGIGQVVTNRPGGSDLLGIEERAALAIRGGRVVFCGPENRLPSEHGGLPRLDCEGRAVLPGFVDPHTHLVFAGDRADEFAARLAGRSYEETLEGEGGIYGTVRATRESSLDELVSSSFARLERMLAGGSTTIEVKSGYGLDVATERRILEAIRVLDQGSPADLVPTFLGAHLVPLEYREDREGYLRLIEEDMLAACTPLARYCDVFCDRGAFTVEEARRVLEAGGRHGLRPRIHANELGPTGGAELAAQLGVVSADHLAFLSDQEIEGLAAAGTVAVLLPATSFSLGSEYAPGRRLWDAGVTVALGTDCNPGTSYTESMQFVIALACHHLGLSPEEAVWSATRGGALAVEEPDKGRLVEGAVGDAVVLDAPSFSHLPYRPAAPLARWVIKDGRVVVG